MSGSPRVPSRHPTRLRVVKHIISRRTQQQSHHGDFLKYTCVEMILPSHPSESSIRRYTALTHNHSQRSVIYNWVMGGRETTSIPDEQAGDAEGDTSDQRNDVSRQPGDGGGDGLGERNDGRARTGYGHARKSRACVAYGLIGDQAVEILYRKRREHHQRD